MPMYFFDVHDGRDIIDDHGSECEDLAAARVEAGCMAVEMLRNHPVFETGEEWKLLVRSQEGSVVASVTFSVR